MNLLTKTLRGTTAVLAVLVVLQPILAGGFLSGHYDLLRMHRLTGFSLFAVALAQAVVVVFLVRRGGSRSLLGPGLMLPALVAAQAALGIFRILALHIPFGVMMVIGITHMARNVWRPPAADDVPVAAKAEVPA
nr:hypothetical protein [uncultured Actinoplanes sp.]